MDDKEDLNYPGYAFIALARRGMEKISLDQCFLSNCDNEDPNLLEPIKKEVIEEEKKPVMKPEAGGEVTGKYGDQVEEISMV